jgi:hypothetical protein
MPTQYEDAWRKFHEAVIALVSISSIEERLGSACVYYLSCLKPEDIPDELQDDFKQIQELQTAELPGGGVYAKNIKDYEAQKLAEKIVSMYDNLTRRLGAEDAQYESGQNLNQQ